MIKNNNITGIILSGGKSSRMGTDKGFLSYNGKRFAQHSIDALKPLVSEIIIVSDHEDYDVFGLKRVTDTIKNAGPVAGIYSGLKHSKTEYNLVLSCDIPLITTQVLERLIEAIDGTSEIIQVESNRKPMPLIALYKTDCAEKLYECLQNDERRLRVALSNFKVKNVVLNPDEQETAMNVNTKEELKHFKNEYKH